MKLIIIIVTLLSITSCVTTRTERMNSWVGKDVDQLVYSKWGYPDETIEAPNGNRLLVYKNQETRLKSKTVYKPQYNKYGKAIKGTYESVNYTEDNYCKTFFEVDDNSTIVNAKWRCQ